MLHQGPSPVALLYHGVTKSRYCLLPENQLETLFLTYQVKTTQSQLDVVNIRCEDAHVCSNRVVSALSSCKCQKKKKLIQN